MTATAATRSVEYSGITPVLHLAFELGRPRAAAWSTARKPRGGDDSQRGTSGGRGGRTDAAGVVARAAQRLRRLQHEIKHAPSLGLLERSIGRVVDRLMPREIAQLRRVLTAPRAAIAFKAREVVKDMVLGRGEDEE